MPAADHTLRILRLLARQRGPIAARTIAEQLELPRSTVYHLLATLEEHGFVVYLGDTRRYGLGVSAFGLAYQMQQESVELVEDATVSHGAKSCGR